MGTRREASTAVRRARSGTLRAIAPPEVPVPFDPQVVTELRRLLAQASEGPWWLRPATAERGVGIGGPDRDIASDLDPHDAELLVVTRSHLAALLDEVERLRAQEALAAPDASDPSSAGDRSGDGAAGRGLQAVRRAVSRASRMR